MFNYAVIERKTKCYYCGREWPKGTTMQMLCHRWFDLSRYCNWYKVYGYACDPACPDGTPQVEK